MLTLIGRVDAFISSPPLIQTVTFVGRTTTTTTTTTISNPQRNARHHKDVWKLHAIGVLAKKAKQAELRKYVTDGVDDAVMEYYHRIQDDKQQQNEQQTPPPTPTPPGPLQQELTKRKGTITVIAEFKRKNEHCPDGVINEFYDPELLSPQFREAGASAIAVMACERMGGCSYKDLEAFGREQQRSRHAVPGPIRIINADLIIDEIQIARTAACGAHAVLLSLPILGTAPDTIRPLLRAAEGLSLESIVAVSTKEEAQCAIDLGAGILHVMHGEGSSSIDEKVSIITDLVIPEGRQVCTIAQIVARNDKALQEIEEAWALRDKGFNCVWVGDVLYKSGLETEQPGAIIRSMKSKSSLKWASPKAAHGRGEGAREYLGDILM